MRSSVWFAALIYCIKSKTRQNLWIFYCSVTGGQVVASCEDFEGTFAKDFGEVCSLFMKIFTE